jgi:hypothetical protein
MSTSEPPWLTARLDELSVATERIWRGTWLAEIAAAPAAAAEDGNADSAGPPAPSAVVVLGGGDDSSPLQRSNRFRRGAIGRLCVSPTDAQLELDPSLRAAMVARKAAAATNGLSEERAAASPSARFSFARLRAPPCAPPAPHAVAAASPASAVVVLSPAPPPPPRRTAPTALCCDKCDGAHATAACPHFSAERDNHPDARAPAAGLLAALSGPPCYLLGADVLAQPGDGSCLFHSLAAGLADGSSGASLRAEAAAFVSRAGASTRIASTPLSEWVKWDSGQSAASYAARMAASTQWGGGIELATVALLRRVDVHVFEPTAERGRFKRIGFFPADADAVAGGSAEVADAAEPASPAGGREREGGAPARAVHVLYKGGVHYDALRGGRLETAPRPAPAEKRSRL